MRIVDVDGVWVRNKGQFPFVDSTTGVVYQVNELTCVKRSTWLATHLASGVFVEEPSPLKAEPVKVEPVKVEPAKIVKKALP